MEKHEYSEFINENTSKNVINDSKDNNDNIVNDCNEQNDSDSKDSMCSVDSIASKNIDLNSGDEAPEDFIYLKEKIIKRYVVKTILKPGTLYDRPSKTDLIEFEFICFFASADSFNINTLKDLFEFYETPKFYENLNSLDFVYRTKSPLKEFLHIESRIHLNEALKKSLFRMRKGEISIIECNKKYTYDCSDPLNVNEKFSDSFNSNYFNRHSIQDKEKFNFSEKYFEIENNQVKQSFIQKFQKKKLLYLFKLNDYVHYYDLLDNGRVMKTIIENGIGISTPFQNDIIEFEVELRIGKFISSVKHYNHIQLDHLDVIETRIINSMKMKEKSFIEIYYTEGIGVLEAYLKNQSKICILLDIIKEAIKDKDKFHLIENENDTESINNNSNKMLDVIEKLFKQNRVFYIVKLLNFKEAIYKKESINNDIIYKRIISKGVGNSIGYDNYNAFLLIKIEQSNSTNSQDDLINLLTQSFDEEKSNDFDSKIKYKTLMSNYDNPNVPDSDFINDESNFFSLNNIERLKTELKNEGGSVNSLLNFHCYKLFIRSFNKCFKLKNDSLNSNPYNFDSPSKVSESMGKVFYYDVMTNALPDVISKSLTKMSLYETIEIHTVSKIDYIKVNEFELVNSNPDFSAFKFTITLLNFFENKFIFDSIEEEAECILKIDKYREISNYFNKLQLKDKADKINKYVVTETIKHYNLLIKGVDSSISLKMTTLHSPLSKIHSNYIISLYKSCDYRTALEYIEWFIKLYDKNEVFNDSNYTYFKIKIIEVKCNEVLFNFNECNDILTLIEKDLENSKFQSETILDNIKKTIEEEKININKRIDESNKKRGNFIKNMFK